MDIPDGSSLGSISLDTTKDSVVDEKPIETNEYVEKIKQLFLRHNITLTCLEDVVKLVNERPDDFKKLPTGKVQIMEMLKANAKHVVDVFCIFKCSVCRCCTKVKKELGNSNWKCANCNSVQKPTETNHFIYMPIENQIKKSIEDNWQHIINFNIDINQSYTDVHDGSILRNVFDEYQDSPVNILSLCLNTDGANKFKSNVCSVWPIQLVQNYLPPYIRFKPKNIIVCGLHYTAADETEDDIKLDFKDFLLPLITELDQLKVNNIKMNIQSADYTFKPVVTHCTVDLPAKSKLQMIKQFGGYFACTYCKIPGEIVLVQTFGKPKKNKKNLPKQQKAPKKLIRYVENEDGSSHEPRNDTDTFNQMLQASKSAGKQTFDGVKGT